MDYQPLTCVWEVTMGCNMRCGHCGSSCTNPLPDELTTAEALDLCDQLADLGLRWITLSGGEPLTRNDITDLVERLSKHGIAVNIITNGWLMKEDTAKRLKDNGISTIAISIDGTREIHNTIRKEGAFEQAEQAFGILKSLGITSGAVTTVTKQNINILSELKEELIRIGVDSWQLQIGLPMGNLKERPDWVIDPPQILDIIDFCYDTALEGRIKVFPADCLGYYSKKEYDTRCISYGYDTVSLWEGCNAGVRSFGILHNGEILGCTSIRDRSYIEGSIRERSLRSIWEDKDAFAWRRSIKKEQFSGACKTCVYGSKCLGGCPNTRLTMEGDIYAENRYCSYNLMLNEMNEKYKNHSNTEQLFSIGDALIKYHLYQEAAIALKRLLEIDPNHINALIAKGYAEYMCGNYEICRDDNAKALELDAGSVGAFQGYATALYRLGDLEQAISYMEKAASFAGPQQREIQEDLRIMRAQINS